MTQSKPYRYPESAGSASRKCHTETRKWNQCQLKPDFTDHGIPFQPLQPSSLKHTHTGQAGSRHTRPSRPLPEVPSHPSRCARCRAGSRGPLPHALLAANQDPDAHHQTAALQNAASVSLRDSRGRSLPHNRDPAAFAMAVEASDVAYMHVQASSDCDVAVLANACHACNTRMRALPQSTVLRSQATHANALPWRFQGC